MYILGGVSFIPLNDKDTFWQKKGVTPCSIINPSQRMWNHASGSSINFPFPAFMHTSGHKKPREMPEDKLPLEDVIKVIRHQLLPENIEVLIRMILIS